jgi:hypothetical protein
MASGSKGAKRPRDPAQLAKPIVDIATGEVEDGPKDREVSALARKGGLKGGKARAAALTPEQRSEIARAAASATSIASLCGSHPRRARLGLIEAPIRRRTGANLR